MLTQNQLKYQLQIANCCGAKKVNTYIEGLKYGKRCPELLSEANRLFGFIDALKCYKVYQEEEVLETYTFLMTNEEMETQSDWITNLDTVNASIFSIVNGVTYIFPITEPPYILNIRNYINDNSSVLGYTATATSGVDGVTWVLTKNDCSDVFPASFWGFNLINETLEEEFNYAAYPNRTSLCAYPYEDYCLTYEQVLNILAAIKRICNGACTDYVNFQLN